MFSTTLARLSLIPEGPLHPEDAIASVIVGAIAGSVVGRRAGAGPVTVVAAAGTLITRHHGFVPEGFIDRPTPALVIVATSVVALVAVVAVHVPKLASARTTIAAATAGCAGVWATAPDTEPALIGGATLAGSWIFLGRNSARWAPVVMVVPFAAAILGTMGRPERLPLAVAVALSLVGLCRGAAMVLERCWFQRAGTPTTVVPGATSAVTTAPAPTTAP